MSDTLIWFMRARLVDNETEGAAEYGSCRDTSARRERDIEAKQRIVDQAEQAVRDNASTAASQADPFMKAIFQNRADLAMQTVRWLATPYTDHSDYLPEWKP